jgi:hypothetical protein
MSLARSLRVISALAVALACSFVVSLTAQSASTAKGTTARAGAPPSRASTAPVRRTPDGRPDLQGTWDFAQLTPFERPSEFGEKSVLSDEDAEEFGQNRINRENKDRRDGTKDEDVARAYNDFWWDFGTHVAKQPSLLIDPPSGRLPALTAEAQKRAANRTPRYDNVEERPLAERCILGFNSGPPMMPSAYNNNMQLVQTPNQVVILNEMVHSARVIDLSGRPHRPSSMRFLTGDSIGRWDGNTLVVDTTNFSTEGNFRFSTRDMHLIERFSLEEENTLRYEFTMDDPAVWTAKWTASIPMRRSDEQIFEYACHEANYGLEGVLKGARFSDKSGAR